MGRSASPIPDRHQTSAGAESASFATDALPFYASIKARAFLGAYRKTCFAHGLLRKAYPGRSSSPEGLFRYLRLPLLVMIEIDHLRVADFYAWLGCQKIVASQLGCNQSTVSRCARQAKRLAATVSPLDEADFLCLERRVHQAWRFAKGSDLRLHAYRWSNHLLRRQVPASWRINPAEVSVTSSSPLQLLQESVIDALLAPWPVIADLDSERFAAIPVYCSPMLLLAPGDSALALETGVSSSEIADFSQLGRLSFVPPQAVECSQKLDAQFFGPPHRPENGALARADRADEVGRRRSLREPSLPERYWGTPLTPLLCPDLVALPYSMPISYGEFLVCLRCWLEHGEMAHLFEAIRHALAFQRRAGHGLEALVIA